VEKIKGQNKSTHINQTLTHASYDPMLYLSSVKKSSSWLVCIL